MSPTKSLLFTITTRTTFVVVLALGFILTPNLSIFDEELLPEIVEHLKNPANPAIEGNATYSLYGIAAATGKDPDTVGRSVVQLLQTKHASGQFANLTEDESNAVYGANKKQDAEWQSAYPAADCNPREKNNCFEELLAQVRETPLTDTRLMAQLERYRHIIELPHFIEETRLLDYTSPLPNYYLMMQLGKLSQASAY